MAESVSLLHQHLLMISFSPPTSSFPLLPSSPPTLPASLFHLPPPSLLPLPRQFSTSRRLL